MLKAINKADSCMLPPLAVSANGVLSLKSPMPIAAKVVLRQRDTLSFGLQDPKSPAYLDDFFGDDILQAQFFATKNHRKQFRKGTRIPYMAHATGVASTVLIHALLDYKPPVGTDLLELPSAEFPNGITIKDAYFAALMHDLVEDQGGMPMYEKIRQKFGDTVAKLVLYCSDLKDDATKGFSYNERKRLYLERIANGPATALLISASDKLDNLRLSVPTYARRGERFWQDFKFSKEEKLQYYGDVIRIFGATGKYPHLIRQIEHNFDRLNEMMRQNTRLGFRRKLARFFQNLWQSLQSLFRHPWDTLFDAMNSRERGNGRALSR